VRVEINRARGGGFESLSDNFDNFDSFDNDWGQQPSTTVILGGTALRSAGIPWDGYRNEFPLGDLLELKRTAILTAALMECSIRERDFFEPCERDVLRQNALEPV